jgi:oligo-1,6-glucosidase
MLTRWGNDSKEFRVVSAKMLITFLLTMRATPIFFNGDELGMANIKFEDINDYRDVEIKAMYNYFKKKNQDVQQFMNDMKYSARDNSRTPFQWDASANAGFTTGTPWIKVNADHEYVNQEAQEKQAHSVLNYFRKMVDLRKSSLVLVYGHYSLYDYDHNEIYAYTRTLGKEGLFVVLNFSGKTITYPVPAPLLIKETPLVNNESTLAFDREKNDLHLLPYQALIFELAP